MSHVVLKDYPQHLTKYEDKRTKISSFKLLLIGENLEVQTRLFKKYQFSISFMNCKKLGSILYTAQDQHFKIQILNLLLNCKKLCPKLSFTVESEMGNSHKKRMVTF